MRLKDFTGEIALTSIKDVELTKDIQSHLGVSSDGIIGNQTIAAFGRFKKENHLSGKGLLGHTTAQKLLKNTIIATASQSNAAFRKALAFVLQWEGGYSNHPSDTGGETNKGVTWRVYNNYRRSHDLAIRSVKHLTQQELEDIYRSLYWTPAGCDDLPPMLAQCHLDWAINAGVGRAQTTMRQAIAGVPLKTALSSRGERSLCGAYNNVREVYYRTWGRGSQSAFLDGWLNRLQALKKEVGAAAA